MMSAEWVLLRRLSEIPEGLSGYRKKRKRIAVVKTNGEITQVFEDNCPHNSRIMLSDNGEIDLNVITCTLHGRCFDLVDGKVLTKTNSQANLIFYEYKVEGNKLMIKIESS